MSDRQLIADLLSALEYHTEQTRPIEFSRVAIEAAREYLRKPAQQQEPVAVVSSVVHSGDGGVRVTWIGGFPQIGDRLYTSQPASKPWVGLTNEEIGGFKGGYQSGRIGSFVSLVAAIEAKLREKNA